LEQLIILKVALPNGHCKQVAEPAAETAPPGQVVQEDTKTEKWFGLAVSGGQSAQEGLFMVVHKAVK